MFNLVVTFKKPGALVSGMALTSGIEKADAIELRDAIQTAFGDGTLKYLTVYDANTEITVPNKYMADSVLLLTIVESE